MNSDFKQKIYELVGVIPHGRVMTYGQIAALCGHPGAARVVGQIAHFGHENLPWHRVVNAKGGMASGFWPGGRDYQAKLLQEEGIRMVDLHIRKLENYLWWPSK